MRSWATCSLRVIYNDSWRAIFLHEPLSNRGVFNSVMDPRLGSGSFFSWNLRKKNIYQSKVKSFHHIDNRDMRASGTGGREMGGGGGSIGMPCSLDPLKISLFLPLFRKIFGHLLKVETSLDSSNQSKKYPWMILFPCSQTPLFDSGRYYEGKV